VLSVTIVEAFGRHDVRCLDNCPDDVIAITTDEVEFGSDVVAETLQVNGTLSAMVTTQ